VIGLIASLEVLHMLNLEYARLVDEDRRRVAQQRLEVDRLVHPDDPPLATLPNGRDRRAAPPSRPVGSRSLPDPVR
jgi:hypothetical protein